NCCGSHTEVFSMASGDAFDPELVRRLPLATAVLETFRFAFDDARLAALPAAAHGAADARRRLRELLKGSWDPLAYTKAADKKPRPHRPAAVALPRRHH